MTHYFINQVGVNFTQYFNNPSNPFDYPISFLFVAILDRVSKTINFPNYHQTLCYFLWQPTTMLERTISQLIVPKGIVQLNNKNPIHFLKIRLRPLDFYKVPTFCIGFMAHKFTTLELWFDTYVMTMCFLPNVVIVSIFMLQFTPCYTARFKEKNT